MHGASRHTAYGFLLPRQCNEKQYEIAFHRWRLLQIRSCQKQYCTYER